MLALLALCLPLSLATAQQPLTDEVAAVLAAAGPGTRFGLVVETSDGTEVVALAPDDRFVPASTTKLFVTAAAFDTLGNVAAPDTTGGAGVRLERAPDGAVDVILEGNGDARLSSAADCVNNCLAALADVVARTTRAVRHVVGDDSRFPDERWSLGMGWNNIPTLSGTGISALTLDNNEVRLRVTPGAPGEGRATVGHDGYLDVDNRVVVVADGPTRLAVQRLPNSRRLRLSGRIAAHGAAEELRLGVDDPAHHAAWRLAALLRNRGVRVTGRVAVRHRPVVAGDDPATRGAAPPPRPPRAPLLARNVPAPLADDLVLTNKFSQNLHAELLLRRVASVSGTGSVADGQAVIGQLLGRAGVEPWRYDLADGSGMSTYNRVTPRGTVRFLRWTQRQGWGPAFRATLPVAARDGTLRTRFVGTALAGKVAAKTGSLDKVNALAGFMTAASGRVLVFAAYANDMPGSRGATATIDRALLLIAARN